MIPKVIHYCWFGGKPVPSLAVKCIESWRRFLPDYEIRRWDENNFDVYAHSYTRDAYSVGLYAFVSDYARFKILYEHGGLYFDTDVEVIKPLDDMISRGSFMGLENDGFQGKLAVNPGLGLCAEAGMPLYKEILKRYDNLSFFIEDGERNPYSMIPLVTEILEEKGLVAGSGIQDVFGAVVYPQTWLNPFDDATGRLRKTGNTRAIHWYSKSWMPNENALSIKVKRLARRVLGSGLVSKIGDLLKKEV